MAKIALFTVLLATVGVSQGQVISSGEGANYAKESFFTLNAVARQSALYAALSNYDSDAILFDWVAINAFLDVDIYGSAIALEPVEAERYGKPLLCPYSYNCSGDDIKTCTVMDLVVGYDYTAEGTDWYLEPRRRYNEKGIEDGYWTAPYFDAGAGNVNMVTYSHPIIRNKTFLGVATIDILVEKLCYGDQCEEAQAKLAQIRRIGTGFLISSVLLGVLALIWTLTNRQHVIVRASIASMLSMVALGLILSSTSIYFVVHESELSGSCMWQVSTYSLGFVLTFTPLVVKLWKVHRVFSLSLQKKDEKFDTVQRKITLLIPIMLGLDAVILLCWSMQGGIQYEAQSSVSGTCDGEHAWTFLGLLIALHLLLLIAGLFFAYKTRNISSAFSEASYVTLTLLVNLQVILLGICVMLLVHSDTFVRHFVQAAIIFLNNFTTFALLFLPKMYFHFTGTFPHDEGKLGGGIIASVHSKSKTATNSANRTTSVAPLPKSTEPSRF